MSNVYAPLLTIYDLEPVLQEKVKNSRHVLAIGETDMDFDISYKDNLDNWRFLQLAKLNRNLIGLDYNRKNVESANTIEGADVRYADIQDIATLKESLGNTKFDFIFLMDVVEHLSNI